MFLDAQGRREAGRRLRRDSRQPAMGDAAGRSRSGRALARRWGASRARRASISRIARPCERSTSCSSNARCAAAPRRTTRPARAVRPAHRFGVGLAAALLVERAPLRVGRGLRQPPRDLSDSPRPQVRRHHRGALGDDQRCAVPFRPRRAPTVRRAESRQRRGLHGIAHTGAAPNARRAPTWRFRICRRTADAALVERLRRAAPPLAAPEGWARDVRPRAQRDGRSRLPRRRPATAEPRRRSKAATSSRFASGSIAPAGAPIARRSSARLGARAPGHRSTAPGLPRSRRGDEPDDADCRDRAGRRRDGAHGVLPAGTRLLAWTTARAVRAAQQLRRELSGPPLGDDARHGHGDGRDCRCPCPTREPDVCSRGLRAALARAPAGVDRGCNARPRCGGWPTGSTADEFAHVLETFPLVERDQPGCRAGGVQTWSAVRKLLASSARTMPVQSANHQSRIQR